MKKLLLILVMALTGSMAMAQTSDELTITQKDLLLFMSVTVAILAIVVFVYFLYMVDLLKRLMFKNEQEEAERLAFDQQGFWQKMFQMKPLAYQRSLAHNYDGIEELDNPTPPWFMFLFYTTIGFGLIYMVYYHVLGDGNIQVREYEQQEILAKADYEKYIQKAAGLINESNVTALSDDKSLTVGRELFDANCVACHGSSGEGKVGPNLTDEYWIHGGKLKDIFHIINEGVPQKGMIAWKKQLNPIQVQQLTSYIVKLKGTNPPNPKEPQGDKAGGEPGQTKSEASL